MVFKVLICLIQKYLQTSYFFGSRVVCAQTTLFFNELVPKKWGKEYKFLLEDGSLVQNVRRIQTTCNSNQNSAALWRIFHQIKVWQRIGRKDSIQTS